MIKAIDELACTNCGICVDVCQVDVLRINEDGKVYIAYPGDCFDCMECLSLCPFDAIIITGGVPKIYNPGLMWKRIQDALSETR